MALTEEKTKVANETDVIDIDLSPIKKQSFRINGDNDKMLELNTSDMNIVVRLNKIYPKLKKLADEAVELSKTDMDNTEEGLNEFATKLESIDDKMSKLVDELFDANVSAVCKDGGSMYDPFNGTFRYEHIIGTLAGLYTNNFSKEFDLMKQRVNKHTSKYFK